MLNTDTPINDIDNENENEKENENMVIVDDETPWEPIELEPEDLILMVNIITHCTSEGVFKVEDFNLITPFHQRLITHAANYPSIFNKTPNIIIENIPKFQTHTTESSNSKKKKRRRKRK